jgi:hypothetical protein
MTGPICFGRNELRFERRRLVVALGLPQSGGDGSLGSLFQRLSTAVHSRGWNLTSTWVLAHGLRRPNAVQTTDMLRARSACSFSVPSLP